MKVFKNCFAGILLFPLLSLFGCDRLVIRSDSVFIAKPILQAVELERVRSEAAQALAKHGFKERSCEKDEIDTLFFCQRFVAASSNVEILISIQKQDQSIMLLRYSSFGNLIDHSDSIFRELKDALRREVPHILIQADRKGRL